MKKGRGSRRKREEEGMREREYVSKAEVTVCCNLSLERSPLTRSVCYSLGVTAWVSRGTIFGSHLRNYLLKW